MVYGSTVIGNVWSGGHSQQEMKYQKHECFEECISCKCVFFFNVECDFVVF